MLPTDLSHRVAVVTGGASGIGLAIAQLFARCGAIVYVCDWKLRDANRATFAELGIFEERCDVRDAANVAGFIDKVVERSGGVDILVNNAGVVLVSSIPQTSEAEWDAVLDTNLKAAFLFSRLVIPSMQKRGSGAIVNIASNAGLLPRSHDPVYSTSKGSLLAFTRALALCHSIDRIRVNAICPGPVEETQIINETLDQFSDRTLATQQLIEASPMARAYGRMISPLEVAQAALYLVSDASTMVTGTAIAIDGGKSLGVPPPPH